MNTILVTGSAGFIGANLVKRLFQEMDGGTIVGVDNLNDYYDPSLKEYRLRELDKAKPAHIDYRFVKGSIADRELINRLFDEYQFDIVVNLAAQAGVRYSIDNPDVYIESNIIGFYNSLEACRHNPVQQPGVRQQQLRLWRQQEGAVLNGRPCGQSREPLCCYQEEQRALRSLLQQDLQHPHHWSAILHCLRSRRPS